MYKLKDTNFAVLSQLLSCLKVITIIRALMEALRMCENLISFSFCFIPSCVDINDEIFHADKRKISSMDGVVRSRDG